jgi:hypothetical protein
MKYGRRQFLHGAGASAICAALPANAASHGTSPPLTVGGFPPGRTFQRTYGGTSGPVLVTGTYNGTAPTSMMARVRRKSDNAVILNYTALTGFAAANGVWSGTLPSVPVGNSADGQGGACQIDVQSGALTAAGSSDCFVGMINHFTGQSNCHFGVVGTGSETPLPGTSWYNGVSGTWSVPIAAGAVAYLNELTTLSGMPCAGCTTYQDATELKQFIKGSPSNSNLYSGNARESKGMLDQILAIGGCEAMLWMQGENDASIPPTIRHVYQGYHASIQANLVADAGLGSVANLPFFVMALATADDVVNHRDQAYIWNYVQRTHALYDGRVPNIFYASATSDAVLTGGIHWTAPGYAANFRRAAQTVAFQKGFTAQPAKFLIGSASIGSATTTVTNLTHFAGTDFTPTSGLVGLEVSADNGANWVTATGVRTTASSITWTHSALSTTQRVVRYLYGNMPGVDVTKLAVDNSARNAVLNFTIDPIYIGSNAAPRWNGHYGVGEVDYPGLPSSTTDARFKFVEIDGDFMIGGVTQASNNTLVGVSLQPVDFSGTSMGSPIVGSVVGSTSGGTGPLAAIFQIAGLSGVKLAHLTLTFASNLGGGDPDVSLLFRDGGALNSTTGAYAGSWKAAGTNPSVNIATVAGGFMVAVATSIQQQTTITGGTETIGARYPIGTLSFVYHSAGDAAPVSANASNSVTATPAAAADSVLAVATWH